MNKRIVSMLLAVLMLLTVVLYGCGSEDDEDSVVSLNADSTNTRTVVIAAITGESTTADAINVVETAMNNVSKKMYKTQVILKLMTADEYEATIDRTYAALIKAEKEAKEAETAARKAASKKKKEQARIDAQKKVRSKWVTQAPDDEETSEVQATMTDEYGRVVLEYPEADEYQIDVVFMTGVDMFYRFYDKDYLMGMNEIQSEAQKDLSKYIYPTFMSAGKVATIQYAIPSNQPLGYYTYFLVNKELANKYGFTPGEKITLQDCESFLDNVKSGESVTPINTVPEMKGLYYLTGEESPIGAIVNDTYQAAMSIQTTNLLENESYIAYQTIRNKLINGGYVSDKADDSAIKVVNGFYNSPEFEDWEDYYVSVYSTPRATNETLYSGLYGVSSYSMNPDRAYEIINLLNTNSDFRNAFQYGVEGVNYKLNENGTVHMLNDTYSMNLYQTGNVYMAYLPEDMPVEAWESAKQQNLTTDMEPFAHVSTETMKDSGKDYSTNLEEYQSICEKYREGLKTATDVSAYLAQFNTANGYKIKKNLDMTDDNSISYAYAAYAAAREA